VSDRGTRGAIGVVAAARVSSNDRVNEKPPCIEMLIVKIVYYFRKVI